MPKKCIDLPSAICILIYYILVQLVAAVEQNQCVQSLLLNKHRIPSDAITATSERADPSGRRRYSADALRAENTDFAWSPSKRVGPGLNEFVQVDMGELNVITKLVISGLLAESGGYCSSPFFYVRYKREWSEPEWRTYRTLFPSRTTKLVGSQEVPKFVALDPPLVARWIRIYPFRETEEFVCIRLEAYGCRFKEDLLEYQIPEGSIPIPPYQAPPPDSSLLKPSSNNTAHYYEAGGSSAYSDQCYDGYRVEPGSLLDGGLGCLTDLSIAPRETTPSPWGSKTNSDSRMFVGWHRSRWVTSGQRSEEGHQDVVNMRFRFANVRQFQHLKLFVSNNYVEKIRLPKRIEVRFSVGGVQFSGQPAVSQDFLPDNRTSGVMRIEMSLDNRIGQFVQLKAFFADDWLLFSEISFSSHLSSEPVLPEDILNGPGTTEAYKILSSAQSSTTAITELAADLNSFSQQLWPTVITLAVLIVIFLGIICFTCARLCWKRNYWQLAKTRRSAYRPPPTQQQPRVGVTEGLLSVHNPNTILFSPDGTFLKTPSSDAALKLNGSIYPQAQSDGLSGRFFNALCPRKRSRLLSQTSQPNSRSMSDSPGQVQPYSTVSKFVDSGIGLTGNLNQISPHDLLNSYPTSRPGVYPNGGVVLSDELLMCSSASNSTGASLCPPAAMPHQELNLYTSVGGESDADSNCASTMSPEYASTNMGWTQSSLHHPSLQQPCHSYLAVNPTAPTQFSTSMALNGRSGNTTTSAFPPPFVYYNPGILCSTDAETLPFYNQVSFPAVTSIPGVYLPAAYAADSNQSALHLGSPLMVGNVTNWGPQPMCAKSPMLEQRVEGPTSFKNNHLARPVPDSIGPWIRANRTELQANSALQDQHPCPPIPQSPPPPPPSNPPSRLPTSPLMR